MALLNLFVMSLHINRIFSFFLIILISGLTGFRTYHTDSSPAWSSAFSYSLLHGSKVTIEGATNVNEFACFSDETYSQHAANLFVNDLKNNITFQDVILNIPAESL